MHAQLPPQHYTPLQVKWSAPVVHKALDAKALRSTGLSMLLGATMLRVVMAVAVSTDLMAQLVCVLVAMLMLMLARCAAAVAINMVMVSMRLIGALAVMTPLEVLYLLCCTCGCNCAPVLALNVQVCHNLVHLAAKHTLQRHL
jgi:hypothetical protein